MAEIVAEEISRKQPLRRLCLAQIVPHTRGGQQIQFRSVGGTCGSHKTNRDSS